MVDKSGLSVEDIFSSPTASEAPHGWVSLTSAFFSGITPDEDLTNFFNGGEPNWEAVANPRLQRIQLTESLLERTRRRIREKKAGIELLIGPTGEGKSTALHQAAAILAKEDSRTILWRQQHDAVLDQSVLDAARDHGSGTVIVSDHAHLIMEQLHTLVKGGKIPSSSGLQLLLASRDTDWVRRTRELGFKSNPGEAWKSLGPIVATKHPFGRVSEMDARKIIQSWRALEPNSPDAIQGLTDGDAAKLLSDASAGAVAQHGALLGGLLAIRYTPEELRAHLIDLLETLSDDTAGGDVTLADLVIVLALVDVAGIDGVPSEAVAAFCEIKESSLPSQVASRLGQEAVTNYSDEIMRSRHPIVSEAIFGIAMSDDSGFAVESRVADLLDVVERVGGDKNLKYGYGQIIGLGRELYKAKVPDNLAPRSRRLGIALARRACELRPGTLTNHMSLSECLRLEKQADKAVATVWAPIAEKLLDKANWDDWNKNSRTALNEFAIMASLADEEVDAAIARMAALSDIYRANKIEERLATFSLRGLALHLSRLYLEKGEAWLANALAEIHGCVLACFSYDTQCVKMTTEYLNNTGHSSTAFRTPTIFVRSLEDTLARMSSFDGVYVDIELWSSHITFAGLEQLLTQICEGIDA